MADTLLQPITIEENVDDIGVRRHEWTAEEVYRAMAAGVFDGQPADWLKMELIEGELIEKMPQNRPHSVALSLAQEALTNAFQPGHYVAQQSPLHIDNKSEPEPDVMVVVGRPRDYKSQPTSKEVRLVLEISDTTLKQDRGRKARLYARAGITDYWILILKNHTLEVRREPAPSPENARLYEYRNLQVLYPSDSIAPLHAAETTIRVADLLPDVE